MSKKLVIPTFPSEAQDAAWHQTHKRQLEREMERRLKEGTTLTVKEPVAGARTKRSLRPITIRLPVEDIAAAQELAARNGIGYQTFIRILLREALERQEKRIE
jgi:predicted DNA binding CopG/RHH family protein